MGLAEPAAAAPRRAFLHVGAPKTGTTYLQGVLWRNHAALRQAGLHVLGGSRSDHYRAGKDLMEVPFDPADPGVDWSGAWDRLASAAAGSSSPTVVISDEHLASLSPDQVRRAVDGLAPREVHVVYATRNLRGLMPSEWQEFVKHGSTLDYTAWSTKVLTTPRRGPGRWFWSVHDATDVVARWSTAVPVQQVHVITMPPPSAGRDELWHRFAGVVGVDPQAASDFDVAGNTSLGLTQTEVLRRVNLVLPDDFPRWHRTGLVRDVLASKVLSRQGETSQPSLPHDLQKRLVARGERAIRGLGDSGCDIVGDLADLRVVADRGDEEVPPTSEDLLGTAVEAIAGLMSHMARMRDSRRPEPPTARRVRDRVVAWGDRNRAVALAVDRYRQVRSRLREGG